MTEKVGVQPVEAESTTNQPEPPTHADEDGATDSGLPPSAGLVVDTQDERFQQGKADAFTAWWNHEEHDPKSTDHEYVQGYDFGWEMASDPLHEDSRDPQLPPPLQPGNGE